MKRLLLSIAAVVLFAVPLSAQTRLPLQAQGNNRFEVTWKVTASDTQTSPAIQLVGTGVNLQKISWSTEGTVSAGACALQTAAEDTFASPSTLISAQTVTSSGGPTALTSGSGNFSRFNCSTAIVGTGVVTLKWFGYIDRIANVNGTGVNGECVQWTGTSTVGATGSACGAGAGTIGGSTGSTDNRLLRADGTGGATVQSSAVSMDDSGNISGVGATFSSAVTSSVVNGATAVLWEQHDPTILGTVGTAAGNVGGYKLGFNYQPARWTNGTIGEPNYIDDVWRIGSNIGALSGNRADTAKASLGLTWESKFINDGGLVFQHEFHLEGVTTDGLTAYRPISFAVTHDASIIGGSFTADYLNFASKDGTQMVKFDWQSGNKIINVNQSIKLAFTNNNVPLFTQRNAATNAFLNLPYIDAGDVLVGAQPMYVTGARAGAAATYPGSFVTFQPTSANTNDTMVRLQGLSVTGNHKGISANTTASALFQQEFVNQGAGVSEIYVGVEGAGDPRIQFNDLTGRFVMGIDNSASHIFKISTGSALGTGDIVTIDSSGNMTIIGLKTTGAAGSKKVVCVDTATGTMYASSTGVDCSN